MAEAKYAKYVMRQTKAQAQKTGAIPLALEGSKDWGGVQHRMTWHHVTKPIVLEKEPHAYDFNRFLCFFASNPADSFDFDGEIELSLGKEGEKQIISASSIAVIPKGLVHGPINFKRVDAPILFCDICMGSEKPKRSRAK